MAALAAVLAIAAFVPIVGAQATTGGGQHHASIADKALFFVSDGMRQDAIANVASIDECVLSSGLRRICRPYREARDRERPRLRFDERSAGDE